MKCKICCICICIFVAIAAPLFAGSDNGTDEIIAYTEQLSPELVETDVLRAPIQRALNEGITQESIISLISATMHGGVHIEEAISYLEIITATQAEGLPYHLVMNTILEGIAKGAMGEEIHESLAANRKHIEFCHRVAVRHEGRTGRRADDTALLTTALYNALHMGFNENMLERLSGTITEHNRSSVFFINSLEVLMELHSLGVENKRGALLIDRAINEGYRIGYIRSFPHTFSTQMKLGMTQDEIFSMLHDDIAHLRASTAEAGSGSSQSGNSRGSGASDSQRGSASHGAAQSSGTKKGKGNGGN
jgi:hypothetical protein